ncbi:hypothetical protein [Aminobacter phage Erebus]|nr:hypothetical protein [Aminobacter phage Erebus]
MTAILFSGVIGPVPVSVIMREQHESSLGITELPIETGAKITDHAYVEPKKISLEFADANAAATYNALVRFQESRVPFTMISGLFVYRNMLIKNLSAERDARFSRVLNGKAELQEIIIVGTAYASPTSQDAAPKVPGKTPKPGGAQSTRSATPTAERSLGQATADRTSGIAMRGDSPTVTVPPTQSQSILSRMF